MFVQELQLSIITTTKRAEYTKLPAHRLTHQISHVRLARSWSPDRPVGRSFVERHIMMGAIPAVSIVEFIKAASALKAKGVRF